MQWKCLAGYGKTLSAMKAFPTDSYADAENGAPYIEYSIVTKQAGDYEAEFYMQPSNPVTTENRLQYAVSVNGVPMQILDAVTDDFKIGDHQPVWARGVLVRSGAGVYRCNWNRESIRSGSIRSRRALFLRRS